jgi:hypothetical protein
MDDEEPAPGWDAIDRALVDLYGSQTPKHVGYPPGLGLGSGLQGCSAYDAGDHWHYVTYGLTELYQKEARSHPEVSGWGYEMTLRVVRSGDEVPPWPFNELEFIARYTHDNNHPFEVDDRIDRGLPITGSADTRLTAFAVTLDATLPPTTSPNGAVEFRQLVGITAAELAEMKATSTAAVLDRFRQTDPLLITDPAR